MTVYLLHLDPPLQPTGNRHYLGSCRDSALYQRLAMHRSGRGARFTQVAIERGCDIELARTWEGGRLRERQLKRQKNAKRFCPICRCFQL